MIKTLEEHIKEMKDMEEKHNKKSATVSNQDAVIDESCDKLKISREDAREFQVIKERQRRIVCGNN